MRSRGTKVSNGDMIQVEVSLMNRKEKRNMACVHEKYNMMANASTEDMAKIRGFM